MNLVDYIKENNHDYLRIKYDHAIREEDAEDVVRRGFYPRLLDNTYIELSLDDIEDKVPMDYDENDTNIILTSSSSMDILTNRSEFIDKLKEHLPFGFYCSDILYKDGKYVPCLYDNNLFPATSFIGFLKYYKNKHPELDVPPTLVCRIHDYPFDDKKKEIYLNYSDNLNKFISEYSDGNKYMRTIYIDKDKNESLIYEAFYTDRYKMNCKKMIIRDDFEKIKSENDKLQKAVMIKKYGNVNLGIEFDDNNEFVFFNNENDYDIDTNYDKLLDEEKNKYSESLQKLNTFYSQNINQVRNYVKISKRIEIYNRKLDEYDNLINSFSGKIKLLKKRSSIDISDISFNDIIDKVINDLDEFNGINLNDLNLEEVDNLNLKMDIFNKYIERCFSSIINNYDVVKKYMYELKDDIEKINNQSVFKLLINPITLSRKNISSNYTINKTNSNDVKKYSDNNTSEEILKRINNTQENNLDQEDVKALLAYKSFLYKVINEINVLQLEEEDVIEKEIDSIININYEQLENDYRCNKPSDFTPGIYIGIFDNNEKLISKDKYKDLVFKYIDILNNSLKKVTLEEPISVYRFSQVKDLNKPERGFLSTSIDSVFVNKWINNRIRNNKKEYVVFYKINLPKGAPINFYSNNIMCLGKNKSNDVLVDEQKEVLIDAENYDFEIVTIKDANYDVSNSFRNKGIYYVELNAIPKVNYNKKANVDDEEKTR